MKSLKDSINEMYTSTNGVRPAMDAFEQFMMAMKDVEPTKEHISYMADMLCKYEPNEIENILNFLTGIIEETRKFQ